MIAAIYARKSTSQSDVADVEVIRSSDHARQGLRRRGKWLVIEYSTTASQDRGDPTGQRARLLADATAGKFRS